jgi:hypothetical protein
MRRSDSGGDGTMLDERPDDHRHVVEPDDGARNFITLYRQQPMVAPAASRARMTTSRVRA